LVAASELYCFKQISNFKLHQGDPGGYIAFGLHGATGFNGMAIIYREAQCSNLNGGSLLIGYWIIFLEIMKRQPCGKI
jgi:hypothetical protein